jgi:phospholipid/cholesterol/gamma-HCH transport system substrate-binding protein
MDSNKTHLGLFVVGGLVLFGLGMFLIGDRHQLFARHSVYWSEFVNLAGLAEGAKVRVAGMDAGQVLAIDVPASPSAKFRVKWRIDSKLRGLVRTDSLATIDTEGVVGGTYLSIRPGSPQGLEATTLATIPSREPTELSALLADGAGLLRDAQGTIKAISAKLGVTLDAVTATASNANDVVVGLKEGRGTAGMLLRDDQLANDVRHTLTTTGSTVREIIADLKAGRGAAGLLLRDEAVAGQIRETLNHAQQATADLGRASRQVDTLVTDLASRQIPQKAGDLMDHLTASARQVHQLMSEITSPDQQGMSAGFNIRESLANANVATANLADATEALKHNFLTRGFFKERGYYSLTDISPEKYRRDGVFTNRSNRRVWLPGSELFQKGSGGEEELTSRGKALLDAALTEHGDALFDSPIVIEGYWNGDLPSSRLPLSRRRALTVRQYVQTHFQIETRQLGVMALKNTPPSGLGRATWDGICLVVLRKDRI